MRYFIVPNGKVAAHVSGPKDWADTAFINLKAIEGFEGRWELLRR